MEMIQKRPILFVVLAFVVGFSVGLFIFGWGLTPIQYAGAGPQDLLTSYQETYLRNVADLYAYTLNPETVTRSLAIWPDATQKICQMAATTADPADKARLEAVANIHSAGVGCGVTAPPAEEPGSSRSSWFIICGLGLLLLVLLVVIAILLSRRSSSDVERAYDSGGPRQMPVADQPEMAADSGPVATTPIARFQTTYAHGHDSYDDSFSIENSQGDFLGECGVGISESAGGMDGRKSVAAFEIWLFDKNDIRTITKVIMSDHAFHDEALKAKLASKGEAVLARPGETIVLETATLIINAEILEMEYINTSPAQSGFERFTIEISAWAKEGDFGEPDIQGHIDQNVDF